MERVRQLRVDPQILQTSISIDEPVSIEEQHELHHDNEQRLNAAEMQRNKFIEQVGSEEQFTILLLNKVLGWSTRDIGSLLGISHTTAWRKIIEAERRLRQARETQKNRNG